MSGMIDFPAPPMAASVAGDTSYGRSQPETEGDCDTTEVTATEAVVPWRTLGLQENMSLDGWGRRFTYHVAPELVWSGTTSEGDIVLRDGDAATSGTSELTATAAYALISHGDNGHGAWEYHG